MLPILDRYDIVVGGARCAGASLGMLLARQGARVLVVDPARRGTDTLSTHALMRGGVLQLHRWGVLDSVRAAGTPPVRSTTFHYGDEAVRVDIEPREGVDALYAPRRTVLDAALVDAALDAGAEVVHGVSIADLLWGSDGRVRGAVVTNADGAVRRIAADTVVGADGVHSRVAKLAGAETLVSTPSSAAVIYGYWRGLDVEGYHWLYRPGISAGVIPTNDGLTCVFVSAPPPALLTPPRPPLGALHRRTLRASFPELAAAMHAASAATRLRAFPGLPGFMRQSVGAGWALVGDAGLFRDPITAHGISDALRDAELLARALAQGHDGALVEYQTTRDEAARGLFDLTDRVASFDWDLEELKLHHLALSREMKAGVALMRSWSTSPYRPGPNTTALMNSSSVASA